METKVPSPDPKSQSGGEMPKSPPSTSSASSTTSAPASTVEAAAAVVASVSAALPSTSEEGSCAGSTSSSSSSKPAAGDREGEPMSLNDNDNTGGEVGTLTSTTTEFENSFQGLLERREFDSLAQLLEKEELDALNGQPARNIYERLLAVYLLQNDFHNAKLLWKRIPATQKPADSELCALWAVGRKVAQSDFSGIYEALRRQQWTNHLKTLTDQMLEITRRRAFDLVAKAYESITIENLTTLVGSSSDEETRQLSQNLQWVVDDKMVFPRRGKSQGGVEADKFVANDEHLTALTDYVSFLESH